MRVFDWENGFTPYSATLDGETLTEFAGDIERDPAADVERRSVLTRRPEWDDHANASEYVMSDDFSAGEVDGEAAVWIDGLGYALAPVMGDLSAAVAIVVADQRQGSEVDASTDADIIAHVRDTFIIPGRPYVPGGWHVEGNPDDDDVRAYVAVLSASPEALAAALTR